LLILKFDLSISCWQLEPYKASPTPVFGFSYFFDKFSCFCLGQTSDHYPPTYTSYIAGITNIYHQVLAFLLRRVFTSFLPILASNHNPPDLCFPNSFIIGVSQCAQTKMMCFAKMISISSKRDLWTITKLSWKILK
jgi:hypothetical protein